MTPATAVVTAPRLPRHRESGWTAAVQAAFIDALERTGNVGLAAASVGRSKAGAYRFRARPDANRFRAAWDAAQKMAYSRLCEIAFERIVTGVAAPIVYRGEAVGTKTVYSDRLLMFMLTHLRPATAVAQGLSETRDAAAEPMRAFGNALNALHAAAEAEATADDQAYAEAAIADGRPLEWFKIPYEPDAAERAMLADLGAPSA